MVRVGRVAHGGHCVARADDGRVLFVRHALPGELVRCVVTEGGPESSYWRADAVDIVEAAAGRVQPPCPWAGPGRCGGCDWQHASAQAQRRLKADVVEEQLQRLAGIDRQVVVEPVPGHEDGLGWRTRMTYAVAVGGRAGLRGHRSHRLVPVDWCRIAHPDVREAAPLQERLWPGAERVMVAVAAGGSADRLVLVDGEPDPRGSSAGAARAGAVVERVNGRDFRVTGGRFWQVHPAAARVLVDAVLTGTEPMAGERALDLYGGVGLFAAALAARVGPQGSVTLVEADRVATEDARHNLAGLAQVRVRRGRVDHVLRGRGVGPADLVVLDPPRSGAGRAVVRLVSALRVRRVAYVACDPAALARDLRWFAEHGLHVSQLRAFDLFPMTHHVECVAILSCG